MLGNRFTSYYNFYQSILPREFGLCKMILQFLKYFFNN